MSKLQQFDQLKADIILKVSPSLNIKVDDKPTMNQAVLAGKEAKHYLKMIEEKRKELVAPLNAEVKAINDRAKEISEPILKVENHLKGQLTSYERVLEKERQAEQERIDAENQKKREELEEKARQEKERQELAASFGLEDGDEVAQKRQELVAKAEQERETAELDRQEKEQSKAVSSNRVSGARKVWKFDVIDASAVPREFLIVDESAIRRAVGNGAREIPGVKIYQDVQMSLR